MFVREKEWLVFLRQEWFSLGWLAVSSLYVHLWIFFHSTVEEKAVFHTCMYFFHKASKILNKTFKMMFGSVQTKSVVKPGAGHWWFKVCFQGFLFVLAVRNLNRVKWQGGGCLSLLLALSCWETPFCQSAMRFFFPKWSCLRQNGWSLAGDLDTWSKQFKS